MTNKPWNVSDNGKYYIESLQVVGFERSDGEHIRVSWPINHFSKDGKYVYTEDGGVYSINKGDNNEESNN